MDQNISRKVKLALVLKSPVGGGAERFMINLLNNISRDKFNLNLILFNGQGDYAHLIPSDLNRIDLGMNCTVKARFPNPEWVIRLANAIKAIKPDVIFSTMGFTNLMVLLAKDIGQIKVPVVIQEQVLLSKHLRAEPFSSFKIFLYRLFCPRADAIVSLTREMVSDLENLMRRPLPQTYVIPNFIDERFIEKKLSEPVSPAEKKKDLPVIISVGRMDYQKAFDVAIKAFAAVREKHPCYYWILGQGPQEAQLKSLAKSLGVEDSISFLGFQNNPYHFMRQANIFLLSSRFEGFPNVLLEAMHCGLPAVVTKYDNSVNELVVNEENGLVADVDDIPGISVALEKMILDPALRSKFAKASLGVVGKFSEKNILHRYEDLFEKVAYTHKALT